jgi:acetyl esterase/lipase
MLQPREGLPVAKKFMSFGYSGAILRYSVHPKCYPIQYNQGLKAIELLSSRFKKIILIGFSAGGHLSGLLGTTEREKIFNAVGMILCYPVISFVNKVHKGSRDNFFGNKNKNDEKNRKLFSIENRVNPNTLPTFIWTCRPDTTVPYENSLFMIKKLKENKVFHVSKIFKTGRHGIVLAEKNKEVSKWVKLACNFIDEIAKK